MRRTSIMGLNVKGFNKVGMELPPSVALGGHFGLFVTGLGTGNDTKTRISASST